MFSGEKMKYQERLLCPVCGNEFVYVSAIWWLPKATHRSEKWIGIAVSESRSERWGKQQDNINHTNHVWAARMPAQESLD